MKKLLVLSLTVVLMLSCLTACCNGANRFYNSKVLKEFQITDFPKPQGVEDVDASSNDHLCFNTTKEGFEEYAEQLYTYLVGKDFKYFGYRGDVLSTFFGGAPEYEFYISSELADHQYLVDRYGNEYENCYVFVFSDEFELSIDNGLLNDCAIELEYNPDDEEYNTHLSILYNKNVLTSYTLITDDTNTPEHEHTGEWRMSEEGHSYKRTCGCPSPDTPVFSHFDDDGDGVCDVCGYIEEN